MSEQTASESEIEIRERTAGRAGPMTKGVPHIQAFLLCPDDDRAMEQILTFTQRYQLVEVDLPEFGDPPADHTPGELLPLPQWLAVNRARHGTTVRAFLHTTIGTTSQQEQRTVFLLRTKGNFWWADVTEFLAALTAAFGRG